jgi:hypothetical protein
MAKNDGWEDAPSSGWEDAPAAASLEGMPGQRKTPLFERLMTPQRMTTTRVTPQEIAQFREGEFAGAPGVSAGVDPRAVAYPIAEMGATMLGGALGGIPGAGAAYAGVKALERPVSEYKSVPQAATLIGKDVLTGAAYQAVPQVVAKGLGKAATAVAGKLAPSTAKTTQQLKAAETAAWDVTKGSTQTFKDPVPLQDSVRDLLSPAKYNYDPDTFSALKPVISRLDKIYMSGLKGTPTSIHELRTIRTMLQDVEQSGAKTVEKGLANAIKDELDSYVLANGGADALAWAEARSISNQLFRSRDIKELTESVGSKEIRKKFTELIDSNAIRAYTPEQQQLIQQIANGTATEKSLEMLGALAPQSVGWQKIAALAGFTGFGSVPLAAGIATTYGLGAAGRATANALAKAKVNQLDELIRGGQLAPPVDLNFLRPAGTAALMYGTQPSQNELAR